ncbi:MAG: alpha/beta hydrolase [Cyanobacteria bacterium SID2]|nr:alpha/beta hydrolase [Cyanobacteria bacterium SID2]MBP0002717.1 alpha/beta hydrolase [Cyanobacteria bacterium SBC]
MLDSMPRPQSWLRPLTKLLSVGSALAFGVAGLSANAIAAERLVFTYGAANRDIQISDLETLVETGEIPRDAATLRFIVDTANITAEDMQTALTQELSVSLRFIDDVTYSLPGEYVLFQMGQVFHNRGRVAEIQSLRAAFINSVSSDGKITLLEFLQNYPNRDLYIDGARLLRDARTVIAFAEDLGQRLEVPLTVAKEILEGVVCECEAPSTATAEE